MNFDKFKVITSKIFKKHLNYLNKVIDRDFGIKGDYSFTNYLRFAKSSNHYICELCGSNKFLPNKYISVHYKKGEKIKNTSSFFVPGLNVNDNMTSVISLASGYCGFTNLIIGTEHDNLLTKDIFNMRGSKPGIKYKEAELPITIKLQANFISIINTELIRVQGVKIYYRIIPSAFIIQKSVNEAQLKAWLSKIILDNYNTKSNHGSIIGLNIDVDSINYNLANQLYSISNQDVKETDIDSFIEKNKYILTKPFDCVDVLSQKELIWKKGEENGPRVSKPDFLLKKSNGNFNILDIKTGALKYNSLTKSKKVKNGGRVRLRFVDYVDELIAQLHDYKRYFNYSENRDWAYKKYGIKGGNPKIIGIVGNYNNFEKEDVEELTDRYKEEIKIISYFDLANMICSRKV